MESKGQYFILLLGHILYGKPRVHKDYSAVARAFLGGRVAHPEGKNEEENK